MIIYNLYPPFLYIPEEDNFSDAWEAFCLKLLKIDMKTNDIERRAPPEQGVDLYFKLQKKAYQCKSNLIESKFNITNAKDSLKDALKIKDSLPWEKYYICSNINLNGKHVNALQAIYKDVEPKGKDYWIGLCKNNPALVQNNFRTVLNVNEKRIREDIDVQFRINQLNSKLHDNPITVLFYCELHNTIYKLTISKDLRINDLLEIFRYLINFSETYSEYDGKLSISHYIVYNGKKYFENEDCSSTLGDIGIVDNSIITYFMKIKFLCNNSEFNIMQFNSSNIQIGNEEYLINKILNKFDNTLEG